MVAIDGYDLSPGQLIAISKPANFKVLVSQWSPTVQVGCYYYQKQVRRHNRQIHKINILKGGRRKNNQAAYEVQGFRLFDKVKYEGQIGFIFGRRSIGYFDVRRLDGTRISASANYKKLRLLQKRKSYLTELRT